MKGVKAKKMGSHKLNRNSSRSHSIFTIYIIKEEGRNRKFGKINFVDLAGSERIKGNDNGDQMMKETSQINKSLFVLGQVISSLSNQNKKK